MKLKAALMVVALAAGLSTSVALANNGNDKGNGKSETAKAEHANKAAKPCRPAIQLQFAGTETGTASTISVAVTKGVVQGQKLASKTLSVDVSKAKVHGTLADNALVRVHARACIDFSATPPAVTIVAQQVNVAKTTNQPDHTTTG